MRQEYIIARLKEGDSSAVEIARRYCAEHPKEDYWTVLSSTKSKMSKLTHQGYIEKKEQKTMLIPTERMYCKPSEARIKVWVWGLVE